MKILITAQGVKLDSPIDPRFGRAKQFIVYETETDDFVAHENSQNAEALQGAGIQAGRQAFDLNVKAVLTGHVGPKAYATLLAAEIDVYTNVSGAVQDAVKAFKEGNLERAMQPDVSGHW